MIFDRNPDEISLHKAPGRRGKRWILRYKCLQHLQLKVDIPIPAAMRKPFSGISLITLFPFLVTNVFSYNPLQIIGRIASQFIPF